MTDSLPVGLWQAIRNEVLQESQREFRTRTWLSTLRAIRATSQKHFNAAEPSLYHQLPVLTLSRERINDRNDWLRHCTEIASGPLSRYVRQLQIPLDTSADLVDATSSKLDETVIARVQLIVSQLPCLERLSIVRYRFPYDLEDRAHSEEVHLPSTAFRRWLPKRKLEQLFLGVTVTELDDKETIFLKRSLNTVQTLEISRSFKRGAEIQSTAAILQATPSLRALGLTGEGAAIGKALPLEGCICRDLKVLALNQVVVTASSLCAFLTNTFLNLSRLSMIDMVMRSGQWAEIFECMQKSSQITTFSISALSYSPYSHPGRFRVYQDLFDKRVIGRAPIDRAIRGDSWSDRHALGDLIRYFLDQDQLDEASREDMAGSTWSKLCSLSEVRLDKEKFGRFRR